MKKIKPDTIFNVMFPKNLQNYSEKLRTRLNYSSSKGDFIFVELSTKPESIKTFPNSKMSKKIVKILKSNPQLVHVILVSESELSDVKQIVG